MDEAREAAFAAWDSASENRRYADLDSAFDAGWAAALVWVREQSPLGIRNIDEALARIADMTIEVEQPFIPGKYRHARGIAPPGEDEPSVEETIRAMRDEP